MTKHDTNIKLHLMQNQTPEKQRKMKTKKPKQNTH